MISIDAGGSQCVVLGPLLHDLPEASGATVPTDFG
jgi:hypothetical protein